MKKKLIIAIAACATLFALHGRANTCTAFTAPASGIDNVFPAISNGVDGIGWSIARFLWTSDATVGTPATAQHVCYATAAEWGGTYPSITGCGTAYPHVSGQTTWTATASNQIQGAIVSNFLPTTTYHFLAQSLQGGTWCSATDQTFTTAAKPANPTAVLPKTVDTTRPAMTGTHWVYGGGGGGGTTSCGTATGTNKGAWSNATAYSATDIVSYGALSYYALNPSTNQNPSTAYIYWSPLIQYNIQDCITRAQPGDDIGFPGGLLPIVQLSFPNPPLQVAISCSSGGTTCTQSGTAPANGTRVVLGGANIYGVVPSPINPGLPYYVVGASGSSFGLSMTSGGSPITFLTSSTTAAYLPYPLTQSAITIHSTAAANLLPPLGVRLGPDALAQYTPNMPIFEGMDPLVGGGMLSFAPLANRYYFANVGWTIDPAIATTNSANPTDPQAFNTPIQIGLTNQEIKFDQNAFILPPSPARIASTYFNGSNIAVTNSYYAWGDYWQPHLYSATLTNPTISGNVINMPAYTWSYPSATGTKVSCVEPAGTITVSGTGSGLLYLWTNANCTTGGSAPTGVTTSTTISGLTITNSATPGYPNYTYPSPSGLTSQNLAAMPFSYAFAISSGNITSTSADIAGNWFDPGVNGFARTPGGTGRAEGATNGELVGYGPWKFDNNFMKGSAIYGWFVSDSLTNGASPCAGVNCAVATVVGNLTATRSTITSDPSFFYDSPTWDGGNRYWRQGPENKNGRYTLYNGNIIGPASSQVGASQCKEHSMFQNNFAPGIVAYGDVSDLTFTNNTCFNVGEFIYSVYGYQSGSLGGPQYGYPMKNLIFRNNLSVNANQYNIVPANQPFRSDGTITQNFSSGACPKGIWNYFAPAENLVFDHNTQTGSGGCQPFFMYLNNDFPSLTLTNNIFNVILDPGPQTTAVAASGGVYWNAQSYLGGSCASATGAAAIFACMNNFTWGGNIMLATWSTSYVPTVDMTTAQTATAQAIYGGYAGNWPNANTLAARQSQIGWLDPAHSNFRISSSSSYISGKVRSAPSPTLDLLDPGINQDLLEINQGKVSNVHSYGATSTSVNLAFLAPDAVACGVDWGTTAFFNGTGTWTRVSGAAGSPEVRAQHVALTGLPAHGLIYYRVNCQVMQPTGSVQLP